MTDLDPAQQQILDAAVQAYCDVMQDTVLGIAPAIAEADEIPPSLLVAAVDEAVFGLAQRLGHAAAPTNHKLNQIVKPIYDLPGAFA